MEVLESYYKTIIQDLKQGEEFAKLVNEKYLEEHKQLGKSSAKFLSSLNKTHLSLHH